MFDLIILFLMCNKLFMCDSINRKGFWFLQHLIDDKPNSHILQLLLQNTNSMTQYNSHGIFLIQHFKLNKRYNPDLMFIHPSMLCSSLTWREHCYISPPSLRTQQDALFFLNMAWTLLYIATKFENTKRPITKFDNILSFFLTKPQ